MNRGWVDAAPAGRRGLAPVLLPLRRRQRDGVPRLGRALAGHGGSPAHAPAGAGRRFHDPLRYRLDQLADEATDAIAPLLDRPYALFGHSMGASLAFEVASARRAACRRPAA